MMIQENRDCNTDMPQMYWGVSSGGSIAALQNACKNEVISHRGCEVDTSEFTAPTHLEMSFATQANHRMWEGPNWFVDCGGYSELNSSEDGTYDSTIDEYINYVMENIDRGVNVEYWALRDWPVEKKLLRQYDREERNHQRRTIRDHFTCLEKADEYGLLDTSAEPMVVLQGEDVEGYMWMLDYLLDHGLMTNHVCIGSIKDLKINEAVEVAEKVREALPQKHTMHGLGMTKTNLESSGVRKYFDTVDTQAWNKHRSQIPTELSNVRNTWIGYLHAYRIYRNEIRQYSRKSSTDHVGKGTQISDFTDTNNRKNSHESPLRKCMCGCTIDPNEVIDKYESGTYNEISDLTNAIVGDGCRNCRRSVVNILDNQMA